jgi:hypothetical protein
LDGRDPLGDRRERRVAAVVVGDELDHTRTASERTIVRP